ncbi:hypothetical protein APTSU1_000688800 [Apodemus speciosus]|uniref:Uncharacterized protein n=1 Tax=Apodemus speciosus TaxID=105296 RepID=A0ABQ0EX99_APOSI
MLRLAFNFCRSCIRRPSAGLTGKGQALRMPGVSSGHHAGGEAVLWETHQGGQECTGVLSACVLRTRFVPGVQRGQKRALDSRDWRYGEPCYHWPFARNIDLCATCTQWP